MCQCVNGYVLLHVSLPTYCVPRESKQPSLKCIELADNYFCL